ncbi:4Fe-4S cluster-binding domain-containing protein [Tepidibacillus marianensis]|uniref:4Fe-4S cluster-binding domain-containing protein n=1 Tax=Tepidibacillus marianensis TaxID=3131995 RepID=UPI0030D3751E
MKFYKHFIRSFNDLPDHHALLIHSLVGCNFQCFGCHNYEKLVVKKEFQPYYLSKDIISHLRLNGYFFDTLIFNGGEFLLENINEIIDFLHRVRDEFEGIIIINTNGSFPEKIEQLIKLNLVDGIHIDMKLPYHLLDLNEDQEIYEKILGFKPTKTFIERLISSIHIVIKHNSPYSQIRTVKYPILSDQFFQENKYLVENLNQEYGSNIPYYINEFLDVTQDTNY